MGGQGSKENEDESNREKNFNEDLMPDLEGSSQSESRKSNQRLSYGKFSRNMDLETFRKTDQSMDFYPIANYHLISEKLNLLADPSETISRHENIDILPIEILEDYTYLLYRVFNKKTRQMIALKEIWNMSEVTESTLKSMIYNELRAVSIIYALKDTDLILIESMEYNKTKERLSILTEYGKGNLKDLALYRYTNKFEWKEEDLEYILKLILNQMKILYRNKIIHRDIKLENIMVTHGAQKVKLKNFERCYIESPDEKVSDITGTPAFMAPELLECLKHQKFKEYDAFASDLYSLGVVIIALTNPNITLSTLPDAIKTFQKTFPNFYENCVKNLLGTPDERLYFYHQYDSRIQNNHLLPDAYSKGYKQFVDDRLFKQSLRFSLTVQDKELIEEHLISDAILACRRRVVYLETNPLPDNEVIIQTHLNLAFCLLKQRKYSDAEKEVLAAKGISGISKFDYLYMQMHFYYGLIFMEQQRFEEALEKFFKAYDVGRNKYGEANVFVASVHETIGDIYKLQGKYKEAREQYEISFKAKKEVCGVDSIDMASLHHRVGNLRLSQDQLDQAEVNISKALQIIQLNFDEKHPLAADIYESFGLLYKLRKNYKDAISLLKTAKEIKEKIYNETDPELLVCDFYMSQVWLDQKLYDQALGGFTKFVTVKTNNIGENFDDIADAYTYMGICCMMLRNLDAGLEFARKGVKIKTNLFGKKHIELPRMIKVKGDIYFEMHNFEKALEKYQEALEVRRSVVDEKDFLIASLENCCGNTHIRLKDFRMAIISYEKALGIVKEIVEKSQDIKEGIHKNIKIAEQEVADMDPLLFSF